MGDGKTDGDIDVHPSGCDAVFWDVERQLGSFQCVPSTNGRVVGANVVICRGAR